MHAATLQSGTGKTRLARAAAVSAGAQLMVRACCKWKPVSPLHQSICWSSSLA